MSADIQDHISVSTEDNDDLAADPIPDSLILTFPNAASFSTEQLTLMATFPWIADFLKLCQTDIGNTNLRSLEKLMKFFEQQVAPYVRDCYSRPNRAAKLKRVMADSLLFFHMTYSDFKPPLEHSSYLAKMSDLMAMYLDMEIKASRTGSESLPKIASKITSSLHVYFGQSHDHILDTILKTKMITKNFGELADLIFRRVLRDSPGSAVHIFSYIRYILAFKMWKGVIKEGAERKRITHLAVVKLTTPTGFREKMSTNALSSLLPKVSKKSDVTAFLMQAKFPVRDKIKIFLKAVQDPKLQCVLDRHNFNPDEFMTTKDEFESNASVNDVLLNVSTESGSRENKLRKFKHNGKIKVEKRQNKPEVIEEIGEDDKPCCGSIIDDISFIKLETLKEEVLHVKSDVIEQPVVSNEEEVDVPMEIAAEVELHSNNAHTEEADSAIKIEETQILLPKEANELEWSKPELQSYYNNISFDYLDNDSKSKEYVIVTNESSPNCLSQEQEVYEIVNDEVEPVEVVDELQTQKVDMAVDILTSSLLPCQQVQPEEVIKTDTTEDGDKASGKDLSIASEYAIDSDLDLIHDYTIKSDSKMQEFLMKVYSNAAKICVSTWFSLLSPLVSEQLSKVNMYRCCCNYCNNNLNVIRINWKTIIAVIMLNSPKNDQDYKSTSDENGYSYENCMEHLLSEKGDLVHCNEEIEIVSKKLDEIIREDSESSSLPLKKRKAFSYSNSSTPLAKDDAGISYPSTPMISIAEIELAKNYKTRAVPYPQGNIPVPNYVPQYSSHPVYPAANNSVIVQAAAKPVVTPEQYIQTLVPGAYATTFIPIAQQEQELTSNNPKFRTPAQMKEYQELSAAHDLINFANSYRSYNDENDTRTRESKRRTNRIPSRKKRKRT